MSHEGNQLNKLAGREAKEERGNKEARDGNRDRNRKTRQERLARKIIREFEKRLREEKLNVTVGDVLRAIQIDGEAGEEVVEEVTVRWVEPRIDDSANDE